MLRPMPGQFQDMFNRTKPFGGFARPAIESPVPGKGLGLAGLDLARQAPQIPGKALPGNMASMMPGLKGNMTKSKPGFFSRMKSPDFWGNMAQTFQGMRGQQTQPTVSAYQPNMLEDRMMNRAPMMERRASRFMF